MNDHEQTDGEKAAWKSGYLLGLEVAAYRVEQLGGEFAFLISPPVAAREIRALKDK